MCQVNAEKAVIWFFSVTVAKSNSYLKVYPSPKTCANLFKLTVVALLKQACSSVA